MNFLTDSIVSTLILIKISSTKPSEKCNLSNDQLKRPEQCYVYACVWSRSWLSVLRYETLSFSNPLLNLLEILAQNIQKMGEEVKHAQRNQVVYKKNLFAPLSWNDFVALHTHTHTHTHTHLYIYILLQIYNFKFYHRSIMGAISSDQLLHAQHVYLFPQSLDTSNTH